MIATFSRLAVYMKKNKTNEFIHGQTANYNVPDAISKGMNIMIMEELSGGGLTTEEENPDEDVVTLEENDFDGI